MAARFLFLLISCLLLSPSASADEGEGEDVEGPEETAEEEGESKGQGEVEEEEDAEVPEKEEEEEEKPEDPDKAKVSLGAEGSFVWLTGNTRQINVAGALKFGVEKKKNKVGAKFSTDYARAYVKDLDAWNTTAIKIKGEARYDRVFEEKVAYFLTLGLSRDTFAGHDFNLNIASGPSFQLVKDDTHDFKLELGVSYAFEDYVEGVDPNQQLFIGGQVLLAYTVAFNEIASLSEELKGEVGGTNNKDSPADGRLVSTTAFNVKVSKGFNLKLGFLLTYDFVPPEGFEPLDTKASVTLVANIL